MKKEDVEKLTAEELLTVVAQAVRDRTRHTEDNARGDPEARWMMTLITRAGKAGYTTLMNYASVMKQADESWRKDVAAGSQEEADAFSRRLSQMELDGKGKSTIETLWAAVRRTTCCEAGKTSTSGRWMHKQAQPRTPPARRGRRASRAPRLCSSCSRIWSDRRSLRSTTNSRWDSTS